MTSELNISIWRSLAKQYGTPQSGTPEYEIKERVYRKAVVEANSPPLEYVPPPPNVHEYQYVPPPVQQPYCCKHCGRSSSDPVKKEISMRMDRSEQYDRSKYPRGKPIYCDSSDEEYQKDMDRMVNHAFKQPGKMLSGKVISKKTEMRYARSESDSYSDSNSDSDCEFEVKQKPVQPQKKKKEVQPPAKKKKELQKVEKVVPKKIATTKKKKKRSSE